MNRTKQPLTSEERRLGMEVGISRREFINGCLTGVGAATFGRCPSASASEASPGAPPLDATAFNGFPGVGDYARSNGNTWEVVSAAHAVRDKVHGEDPGRHAVNTGETFDLVIVGAGAAGLGAAYHFVKQLGTSGRCLVLDNHAVFGGEAKCNEFLVDGVRLIAPQGSNTLYLPARPGDHYLYEELKDLGVPLEFQYAPLTGTQKALEFDLGNYMYMWSADESDSIGLFLDDDTFGHSRRWLRNPWKSRLQGLAIPPDLRCALLRWRLDLREARPEGPELDRWLDSMTYRDYLVREHKLSEAIANYTEPFVASGVGLGSSVVSAYCATRLIGMPGLGTPGTSLPDRSLPTLPERHPLACFPGGNSGVLRAFLKYVIPDGIGGSRNFGDVVASPIRFEALDRRGAPVRLRLSSTVVDVRLVGGSGGERVRVCFTNGGRLHVVHAKAAVMATGGWINKHVVHDLPPSHGEAYDSFKYSSFLVANVALRNWRFLEKLGITSCLYTGGTFGFSCNIARPMVLKGYAPPLDPGRPAVLTFYAPLVYPKLDARAQGAAGRAEVLTTSARHLEQRIRTQMVRLFADAGFNPVRDIVAITINRWGHAYVVPEPGYHFARNGVPCPPDVVRQNVGPIAFGAAELRGLQNFRGGVYEAKRALEQVMPAIRRAV